MKTPFSIILISSAIFQIAPAAVPQKAPAVKYTGLHTNSPFTSKPEVVGPGPEKNPLEDYALAGIAPVPGGYRITIINKKNPDMKEVIEPGGKSQFKVVSVNRNPGKTLGTTVILSSSLSSGNVQGTVSFEPELITLKAAPAAAPQPQANGLPPGITPEMAGQQGNPPTANPNAEPGRQPRSRIVPPATPAGGGGANQGGDNRKQGFGGQKTGDQQRTQHRR